MKYDEFKKTVYVVDNGKIDYSPIIAASPITKQIATQPYRVVIRIEKEQEMLVVCDEIISETDYTENNEIKHSFFGNGRYFPMGSLGEALKEFSRRLELEAVYVQTSLDRV